MTRVAIYARCSSTIDPDGVIEGQVDRCRARAIQEGWKAAEVFRDSEASGTGRARAGLDAMLARATEFQVFLVETRDRISRDPHELSSIIEHIELAGGRIATLSEQPAFMPSRP